MPDINHSIINGWLTPAPTGGEAGLDPTHDGDRPAPGLGDRSGGTLHRVLPGRRASLDDTVDRLRENATAAATAIVRLAQEASSDAVRLRAAGAVLGDLVGFDLYASVDRRLGELERRAGKRPGPSHGHDRRGPGGGPVPGGRSAS